MLEDRQLLQAYAQKRSEDAFAELVQRYVNLVYSAALRETHGDSAAAKDISQAVFIELARKAASLNRHPALAGWLYTCVRQMAANARRAGERRERREQEALNMNELHASDSNDSIWRQVQPVLDDAMHELGEIDRAAVVLRYFEERSHKEVGAALGVNESAARKRVDRALEKLRSLLARRGVTVAASGLMIALSTHAVHAAPTTLATTISTTTIFASTATATTKTLLTAGVQKMLLVGALVIAGTGAGIYLARPTAPAAGAVPPKRVAAGPDSAEARAIVARMHQTENAFGAMAYYEFDRIRRQTALVAVTNHPGGLRERTRLILVGGRAVSGTISNEKGDWELHPDFSLKLEFRRPEQTVPQDLATLMARHSNDLTFQLLGEKVIENTPCYGVSVVISESLEKQIVAQLLRAYQTAGVKAPEVRDYVAVRRRLYISKTDFLLRETTQYDF